MKSTGNTSGFEFSDFAHSQRRNLNQSIDNLQCLTFTVSNDLTIFDVNDAAVKLLGYQSKRQLTGRPLLYTIYDPSTHEQIRTLFERLEFEQDLRDELVTLISRNGKIMQVMLNVDTVLDTSGNPLCRVLTHVTFSDKWVEKKDDNISHDRVEDAYKKEENSEHQALVEGIIEQSLFAISISDSSGTLVKANKKFREYLSLSNEELLGKYNILDDANLIENGVIPRVKSVFEDLRPARFNILCRKPVVRNKFHKGNRFVWIHVFAYPVVGNNGALKNVVFQWIDINENDFIDEIFNKNVEYSQNIYRKGHSIVF